VHCWELAMADFGRDSHSSDSLRGSRNFVFLMFHKARFQRFVGLLPEAIEMPFALRTRVGPGKHLLRIADCFEANTVLCSFNTTQPSSRV